MLVVLVTHRPFSRTWDSNAMMGWLLWGYSYSWVLGYLNHRRHSRWRARRTNERQEEEGKNVSQSGKVQD